MSIDIVSSVWKHSKQRGTALLMLIAIADHANEYGEAFPGIDHLAEKCRMKRRNAQLLIKELVDSKELIVDVQEGRETGHGKTNLYTIVTPGALVRDGVQSSTPHRQGMQSTTPRGVQDSVQGVQSSTPEGVQHTTPKPSVEPSRTVSGGDPRTRTRDAAAPITETQRTLMTNGGLTLNQARTATSLREFTPELLDRIKAWAEKIRLANKKPGAILCGWTDAGLLPDDLPAPKAQDWRPRRADGSIDYDRWNALIAQDRRWATGPVL